jgi:hypothetical protein
MAKKSDEDAPAPVHEIVIPDGQDDDDEQGQGLGEQEGDDDDDTKIVLYKSNRLTGYLTLLFGALFHYNAAHVSMNPIPGIAVPATKGQKQYASAVATVTMVLSATAVVLHLDVITPLRGIWKKLFKPKSRFELGLAAFLVIWWSIATGIQTAVGGIAGDGKGQYSLFFSSWLCCVTSWWILERWFVAAGTSSLQSFVTSWPYRAPVWICIAFISLLTLIWYLNLWQNYSKLTRDEEVVVLDLFRNIPEGHWQWLTIITVFTLLTAVSFILAELFRDTKADGSNEKKSKIENYIEGFVIAAFVVGWTPTVVVATIPGGAASLIGNAYFFTWILVVFLFEALVCWMHDYRWEIHHALVEKSKEYTNRQQQVLEKAKEAQKDSDKTSSDGGGESQEENANEEPNKDDHGHYFLDDDAAGAQVAVVR